MKSLSPVGVQLNVLTDPIGRAKFGGKLMRVLAPLGPHCALRIYIDAVQVTAQTRHQSQLLRRYPGRLSIQRFRVLSYRIPGDAINERACISVIETDISDIVVTELEARGGGKPVAVDEG